MVKSVYKAVIVCSGLDTSYLVINIQTIQPSHTPTQSPAVREPGLSVGILSPGRVKGGQYRLPSSPERSPGGTSGKTRDNRGDTREYFK